MRKHNPEVKAIRLVLGRFVFCYLGRHFSDFWRARMWEIVGKWWRFGLLGFLVYPIRSYLVVRTGELIYRIYFRITEESTGSGFKATGLSLAWAGCLMGNIWSVWVCWHQRAQVCRGLAFLERPAWQRGKGGGQERSGVRGVWSSTPGLPAVARITGTFLLPAVGGLRCVVHLVPTKSEAWPRPHLNPFGWGKIWYQPNSLP